MAQDNTFNGSDIREAMRMAATDMGGVGDEMTRLARESRIKILDGESRKDFFRGMTQDEFNIMHDVAMGQGPNGLTALERLMAEAQAVYKEDKKDTTNG